MVLWRLAKGAQAAGIQLQRGWEVLTGRQNRSNLQAPCGRFFGNVRHALVHLGAPDAAVPHHSRWVTAQQLAEARAMAEKDDWPGAPLSEVRLVHLLCFLADR